MVHLNNKWATEEVVSLYGGKARELRARLVSKGDIINRLPL